MEDINKLIRLLKRRGEYLVTGQEKLTLNTNILHRINTTVLSSLHSDHILNHHYLSESLKKITKLKLLKSVNFDLNYSIDVSPFHSLIYLELHGIDIEWLMGLNYEKIEVLTLHGPIKSLPVLLKRKWTNLKYLALRGSHLKTLDDSILLAPYLTYLEVPRNLLTELENVEKLECLNCLNLSINRLTQVPVLSDYGARNLTVLILSYNCINNLTGLSKLTNLKVLDLSNNMIVYHESISAVGDMAFLKYLNLEHNPLAYVENHRQITCGYLHENAATELFELDNLLLTKSEKKFVGQSSRSLDLSFLHYLPSTSVKAKKIRSPVIEDHVWDSNCIIQTPKPNNTAKKEISKLEHLTTKKQIESVREKFGEDNWLHSHAGSYVQDILGIKQPSENESFSQEITENQFIEISDSNSESNSFTENVTYPISLTESNTEIVDESSTVVQTVTQNSNSDYFNLNKDEEHLKLSGNNWYAQTVDSRTGKYSNILLSLTERELKERNAVDGLLIATWSRDSIESCVKIGFDPIKIQLNFMTVRKNLSQRIYIMNDYDSKEFINVIYMELESRTLSEMNQLVFKCVKCATVFCQESSRSLFRGKRNNCCPSCDSSIIVQLEEEPLPSASNQKQFSEINEQNLIEKENSNDSTPINSRSSSEEPEQRILSRNDSDIEIISNPSEKSVEILEVISSTENKPEKTQLTVDVRTALTESSSSGSMTDSVCTAYESRKQHNDSASTNKEMANNINFKIPSIINLPIQFSYEDFTSIDQRLKSYIQHKFFRDKEEFVLIFRCNCIMTSVNHKLDGCVVISNKSLYVFKFIGQPDELLQKVSSHRLSLVKSIATLPWNVGLAICVYQPNNDMKYTFVLFVPHITIRLIAFLERIKPFERRAVLISSPNTNSYLYVNNILYKNDLHLPIIHVVFCESATIVTDNGLSEIIDLPGVVITGHELVILSGECTWLLPYEDHYPAIAHVQHMSTFNHIDINETTLGLHFSNNVSWLLTVNHVEAEHLIGETIKAITNSKQKICYVDQLTELNCSNQVDPILQ